MFGFWPSAIVIFQISRSVLKYSDRLFMWCSGYASLGFRQKYFNFTLDLHDFWYTQILKILARFFVSLGLRSRNKNIPNITPLARPKPIVNIERVTWNMKFLKSMRWFVDIYLGLGIYRWKLATHLWQVWQLSVCDVSKEIVSSCISCRCVQLKTSALLLSAASHHCCCPTNRSFYL